VLGEGHVDVREVVHHLAVQLLRHALIEAAVSCLHVEHGDLPALGGDHREAGVGVAVDEDGLGLLLLHRLVGLDDHLSDGLRDLAARHPEEVVGLADAQLLEEDLVELVVVALPGVQEHVLRQLVEQRDHAAELDELGAGPEDGHDLEAFRRHGLSLVRRGKA